jgi:hypothetical protein
LKKWFSETNDDNLNTQISQFQEIFKLEKKEIDELPPLLDP